ncbi:hypothetical protein ACFC06_25535 [Nocardia sp. NPDC056064]|uniref:hypothetical protein n=1 Tax=Nocardia sp. NPDC056064 TaxID=3345701 RepID=UPI0035D75FA3
MSASAAGAGALCHHVGMSYRGNINAGRPAYTPHQHGATGDSRYPSPRVLRNGIANVIDILVALGTVVAVFLAVLLTQRDRLSDIYLPTVVGAAVLLFVVTLANGVLLPGICGSTIGQLATGLVWIRGADGTWPSATELRRAFFKHSGAFRMGGVQQYAPELAVVRRRDLAAPAIAADHAAYTEH